MQANVQANKSKDRKAGTTKLFFFMAPPHTDHDGPHRTERKVETIRYIIPLVRSFGLCERLHLSNIVW